jgi:hypothetical protein
MLKLKLVGLQMNMTEMLKSSFETAFKAEAYQRLVGIFDIQLGIISIP